MSVMTAEPKVPTMPGAIPFVGHAFTFWRNPLKFFNAVSRQGPLVRIQLGPFQAYLVSDHVLLNDILVRRGKDYEKGMQHDRSGACWATASCYPMATSTAASAC